MRTIKWALILLSILIMYIWGVMYASSVYMWISDLAAAFSIIVMFATFSWVLYLIYAKDPTYDDVR